MGLGTPSHLARFAYCMPKWLNIYLLGLFCADFGLRLLYESSADPCTQHAALQLRRSRGTGCVGGEQYGGVVCGCVLWLVLYVDWCCMCCMCWIVGYVGYVDCVGCVECVGYVGCVGCVGVTCVGCVRCVRCVGCVGCMGFEVCWVCEVRWVCEMCEMCEVC